MKTFMALSFLLTSTLYAKIVVQDNAFYIESKGSRTPILVLNELAKKSAISEVKLFGEGRVNLLAFAKTNESEKLYSVAEDGFIYSIKPFTNYEVIQVTPSGRIQFKQEYKRRYRVDPKGFFLY